MNSQQSTVEYAYVGKMQAEIHRQSGRGGTFGGARNYAQLHMVSPQPSVSHHGVYISKVVKFL